ncbi:hypothetical protein TUM3794_20210 [Shewanella colwelliana]|uniref:Uncharacterized protein n=1 Tax=Shewanella colwelliana TaxID=23 RepID=A0ABQ4P0F3_SHECO|nr:hypothetical protein [Shewanella colwelliana]GIU40970.1 hypothetical protein TUM3794_20210 [Shewanella colwelliana]
MTQPIVSHLYVLKKPQRNDIVRLMLVNHGETGYSIQRTILSNSKTQHYKNKKLLASLFFAKNELERLIFDYEEKGFELRNEITMNVELDSVNCSFSATSTPAPAEAGIPVKSSDIPLQIDLGFNHLKISDLRYNTELKNDALTHFCTSLRKSIAFLPFTMFAVLSGNVVKVFCVKYNTIPVPGKEYQYLCKLAQKAPNSFTLCDASQLSPDYIDADIQAVFSLTGGVCSIVYHFKRNWQKMTLYAQKSPCSGQIMLYAMKDGQYHLVYQLESSLLNNNQNAEFMMKKDDNANHFCDAHFLQRLSYNDSVTEI